jgi:hypothetical protein
MLGEHWRPEQPASEQEISALIAAAPRPLPPEYLDLLRFTNGGEGPVGQPSHFVNIEDRLLPFIFGWFQLSPIHEVIELLNDAHYREVFPNHLFFGGDGGLEQVAFDLSRPEPYPVVTLDPIDGPESVIEVAPDIATFIKALGHKRDVTQDLAALIEAMNQQRNGDSA